MAKLLADALLIWLALQVPVALALGALLRRRQPATRTPNSAVPTAPEEGTHT